MNSTHSSPSEARQQLLSVVVPIYNEEKIIDELHARLTPVLEGIDGLGFEVVLVDDGSSDDSWSLMQQLSGRDPRYRSVKAVAELRPPGRDHGGARSRLR